MAIVPVSLLGRDLVSATLFGGNAAASTGVITWGTGIDISTATGNASWKGLDLNATQEGVDVTPSDGFARTNLTEVINIGFTVREIMSANGITACSTLANGFDFVKYVETYRKRGGSVAVIYRAVMGRIASVSLPHDSGLNVATITADSIGYVYYEGVSPLPTVFA